MLSRNDVINKQEVSKFKFDREDDLYDRLVNLQNHCFHHRCSAYCWQIEHRVQRYNRDVHEGADNVVEIVTEDNAGNPLSVKVKLYKCRMKFGYKLTYPRCGDYTGGADGFRFSSVQWDNNGIPLFVSSRNHPRIVQEPKAMYHWGANADAQVFLTNRKTFSSFITRFREKQRNGVVGNDDLDLIDEYSLFNSNLDIAGCSGLDQYSGAEAVMCYTCGYSCKGSQNSRSWNCQLRSLIGDASHNDTFRKIGGRFAHHLGRQRSVPRDEAMFLLGGGKYTMSSSKVKSCSLTSVNLNDISVQEDGVVPRGFQLSSLLRSYKRYVAGLKDEEEHRNFYTFVTEKYKCVPNFFGYNKTPSWPLDEEWSK